MKTQNIPNQFSFTIVQGAPFFNVIKNASIYIVLILKQLKADKVCCISNMHAILWQAIFRNHFFLSLVLES